MSSNSNKLEFRIPISDINDLKVASNDHYTISDTSVSSNPCSTSVAHQQNLLTDIEDRLVRHPLRLYSKASEHFDPLYLLVVKLTSLEAVIKQRLVQLLTNIQSPLLNKIHFCVQDNQPDQERKHQCRNAIKMWAFLLCVIVRTLEREARSSSPKKKKRKSKKKKRRLNEHYDWKTDKVKVFAVLFDILSHANVLRLWQMNTCEAQFGNMFFNSSMSALENQLNHTGSVAAIAAAIDDNQDSNSKNSKYSSNTIQRLIFDVLGLTLNRYSTNVSACSQLIRMQQTAQWSSEQKLASVHSRLVAHIVTKYQMPRLVHDMFTEIGQLNGKDLSRDTKGTKTLGMFLAEMARYLPSLTLNKISLIVNHLDKEAYLMRNGILQMIGHLIEFALQENKNQSEMMDMDQLKKTRNDLFDLLEIRILDVNSYTRSKVLQIWSHLIQERLVPAMRICKTLLAAIEARLHDRSSIVRKQAIHLLTVLVTHNPWGPTIELNKTKCELNVKKYREQVSQIENSLSELELKISHKLLKQQGIEFNFADEVNKKKQKKMKKKKKKRNSNSNGDGSGMDVCDDAEDQDEDEEDEEEEDDNKEEDGNILEEIVIEEDGETLEEMASKIASFDNLKTKRNQLLLLEMLLEFTQQMATCTSLMARLLSSKSGTDVLECIEFFKVACAFKIDNEQDGFKKMLPLVWNKDNNNVLHAVLSAYHFKYINVTNPSDDEDDEFEVQVDDKQAFAIGARLVKMTNGATLADITCIEELLKLLVGCADSPDSKLRQIAIPNNVYSALWAIFEGKIVKNITSAQRRGALDILRMAAAANPSIIISKIESIVNIGFGPIAEGDAGMARSACMAINTVTKPRSKHDTSQVRFNLNSNMKQIIFDRVSYILSGGFVQSKHWFATAQEAMNLLFSVHQRADIYMRDLIANIAMKLFKHENAFDSHIQNTTLPNIAENENGNENKDDSDLENENEEEKQNVLLDVDEEENCNTRGNETTDNEQHTVLYKRYHLAKFLFILGSTAIKLLVYIEQKENEMKKIKADKENEVDKTEISKAKAKAKAKPKRKKRRRNSNISIHVNSDDSNDELNEISDDELNDALGGAGVEDYEIEQMKMSAEASILDKNSLLGKFSPVIMRIITDPITYHCPILQSSAVLAFTKYMCVSASFCEQNLKVLFTLLEKHKEPSIRANIIIALGDMAFRFPNELDSWSPRIYRNLLDSNVIVRKNTLMVLTHLILNDMIKVRDSISEIALLLLDTHSSISDLARLFFQELSKKGKNPIYNILPDTISRLSVNKNVTPETFKYVMKFLLQFIKKDRQKENLLEKLCNRFSCSSTAKKSSVNKSSQYIAYCLSQLQYNERLMKKICDPELTKKYEDLIGDIQVFQYFKEIIGKCKKFVKPEFKETFEHWVSHLNERHLKGKENIDAENRGMSKLNKCKNRKMQAIQEEEDEDRKDQSRSPERTRRSNSKKNKKVKKKKKPKRHSYDGETDSDVHIDADSDSDQTESSHEQPNTNQQNRRRSTRLQNKKSGRGRGKQRGRADRGRGRGRGRGRRSARHNKRELDDSESEQLTENESSLEENVSSSD